MFENRIKSLNDKPINKKSDRIIYWMQRSVRTEYNHALEYAIQMSNDLKKDLLVVFSLDTKYPEANERSFYFLLESLKDVKQNLEKSRIKFIVLDSSPIIKKLLDIGKDASCIITDRAYLSGLINIRSELAQKTSVRVIQVESDVVIPVETASNKEDRHVFLPLSSLPASIGPPLTKIVGILQRAAAINNPGTFLSQLGIITRPSN